VGELSTNPVKMNFDNLGHLLTGAVDSAGDTLPGIVVPTGSLLTATKVDFALDSTEINKLLGTVDATGTEIAGISSVAPFSFSIDLAGSTQFSTPFTVNDLKQNGLPVGNLTGVDVDKTGVVFAKYSNGFAKPIGQVAMARFADNQSLSKVGNTTWLATSDSGAAIYGAGGDNNFGVIRSSSIENSNVDLSEQLVKLIVAQQAYQANSQTITTEKSLVDTILRI
jgi:flagellar hook protein FlgE